MINMLGRMTLPRGVTGVQKTIRGQERKEVNSSKQRVTYYERKENDFQNF
jgi:hypothetical protein